MIDFLDTSILTISTQVSITVMLVIVVFASLLLGWFARSKGQNFVLWAMAGLGGYIIVNALVVWIIPETLLEEGQAPGKWQILWLDPAFRSDFVLSLVLIVALYFLGKGIYLARAKSRSSWMPDSPAGKINLGVSLLVLAIPISLWIISGVSRVGDEANIIFPLLAFLIAILATGALVYRLERWPRTFSVFAVLLVLIEAQWIYNNNQEVPQSILALSTTIPLGYVFIPLLVGWLGATVTKRAYRQKQIWDVGLFLWGLTFLGFLIRFFTEYDLLETYVYDLAKIVEAPFQAAVAFVAGIYYDILPGDIAEENNQNAIKHINFILQTGAGLIVWLGVFVWLRRLPARSKPSTLTDTVHRVTTTRLTLMQRRYVLAFFLLAPAIGLRLFTTFYPFFETVTLSFQRYNPAFPPRSYAGFRNFERLSTDLVVRESLEFTIFFVFVSTFLQVALGLAVAHLLNANFRLRGISRMISLIPWAMPMVVVAIASRWMFDDQFGMIPDLLRRGLGWNTSWLIDPQNAKVAVVAVNVWKSTPFVALVLLAGLQGVPQDMYDAAKVDGANWVQVFRFLTLPVMMPIIVTISMFMLVWQLAHLDLPFAMTGGGPGFSTTVMAQKILLEINSLNYGFAAALSVVLMMVVFIIGSVGMYIFRRVEISY